MKYKIVRSRGLFIIYEEDKIIKYYYTYKDAEDEIRRMEYVELIHVLMNDY
jgi:hypothetical protein